jgi:hypothetical protein
MPDEQTPSQPQAEFKVPPPRESTLPWPAIGIGFVCIAVVVGLFILLSRHQPQITAKVASPYAGHLDLENVKLSLAENFIGGTVTYIDGQVANTGDKTVTHATVSVKFQNSLGQIAQLEELPLQVLDRTGPYPQAIDLKMSPLKPQQSREFRLTLSHVSTEWNQQIPDLKVMQVETQ